MKARTPQQLPAGRWPASRRALVAGLITSLAVGTVIASGGTAGAGLAPDPATAEQAGVEEVAPGVTYEARTLTTSHGQVRAHIVRVSLGNPRVAVDLLYPGWVAARDEVSDMADARRAVAGVNGDFFNIGQTNAPVGPAIAGGTDLKAAVPNGQRHGPGMPPGITTQDVIGVDTDERGRLARLTLDGKALTPDGGFPLDGLNQYAIRENGVGLFTPAWGTATRKRSTCGTDTNRNAPCSTDTIEVTVTGGVVTNVTTEPGTGAIGADTVVLVGREAGTDRLEGLEVGDTVDVDYRLAAVDGARMRFAVGGFPILRDGAPLPSLDTVALAPRTAAGFNANGNELYLVAVDGRSGGSVGMAIDELASLLRSLGAAAAVNLDGGGSTALVARRAGDDHVTVRNNPSDGAERPVPNGIGIFTR